MEVLGKHGNPSESHHPIAVVRNTVGQSRVRIWKEYPPTVYRFTAARCSIISVR